MLEKKNENHNSFAISNLPRIILKKKKKENEKKGEKRKS